MDLIYQNPFRVLGLPVTSSDKDIAKRIGDISLYADMGKPIEYDVDHYFPIKPIRSKESVKEAKQSIDQPFNKLFYALFWFWEGSKNTVDEMAFNELKNGNVDKALQFWEKEVEKGANSRNKSNRKNLAMLLLGLSQEGGVLNKEYYLNSLSISGEFLASGDFGKFSNQVLGANHNVELTETVNQYVDEMVSIAKQNLGKRKSKHKVTVKEILDHSSSYSDDISAIIEGKFIGENIYNIEQHIEIAQNKRKKDTTKSNKAGFELFENTQEDIKKLKSVLSKSDLKYQLIADKLAEEILQCGISYFNEYFESETDPGDESLELTYHAREIAIGNEVIDRISEGIDNCKEYINNKPKREKLKPVQNDFTFIYDKLRGLNSQTNISEYPTITRRFVESCIPKLNSIKNELGTDDEDYLELSDIVAGNAMGLCYEMLNSIAKYAEQEYSYDSYKKRGLFAYSLNQVEPVFDLVGKLHMSSKRRTDYNDFCNTGGFTARRPPYQRGSGSGRSTRDSTTTQDSGDEGGLAFMVVFGLLVLIIVFGSGGC